MHNECCPPHPTTPLPQITNEVCKLYIAATNIFLNAVSEGKRHDAGMLRDSGLMDDLENHAHSPTGQDMCLYGDPAYPLRVHLQAPFRDARLTPGMEAFNLSMSRVRTSVEWIFGDVIKSFKAMDFKSNLKIGLSTVGKMYIVCALMRNAITCMYGNQTCDYFGLEPPTVNEYFS